MQVYEILFWVLLSLAVTLTILLTTSLGCMFVIVKKEKVKQKNSRKLKIDTELETYQVTKNLEDSDEL